MKQFNYFVGGMLALSVMSCNRENKARELYIKAGVLEDNGEYEKAIVLLDEAIQLNDRYVAAYINRGADKSDLKQYEAAIKDYETALSIDPKNILALFNTGNNYKRLKNYNKAIEFYNKAFVIKKQMLTYNNAKGEINITENSKLYDVPIYAIYYERGIAYCHIKEYDLAISDFNVSLENNFMIKDSYLWIADIYILKGDKDAACSFYQLAKQNGATEIEEELLAACQ